MSRDIDYWQIKLFQEILTKVLYAEELKTCTMTSGHMKYIMIEGCFHFKRRKGFREVAQQFLTLIVLEGDLDLILRTYIESHNYL